MSKISKSEKVKKALLLHLFQGYDRVCLHTSPRAVPVSYYWDMQDQHPTVTKGLFIY